MISHFSISQYSRLLVKYSLRKSALSGAIFLMVTCLATSGVVPFAHAQGNTPGNGFRGWVSTWTAGMVGLPVDATAFPLLDGHEEVTIQQAIHLSAGGNHARVVITNEFGLDSLVVEAAALRRSTSKVQIPLTFGGKASVVIPPGAIWISDPVFIRLAPLSDLTVTLVLPPQALHQLTIHTAAHQTNYITTGNLMKDGDWSGATPATSWYFLKAIEVQSGANTTAIAVLGDSISDGSHSTPSANRRWPDDLARRIFSKNQKSRIAILNAGIGGNRILHDKNGPSALARLDRDVLSQPGVTLMIMLEGINDIAHATDPQHPYDPISAHDLIDAYQQVLVHCHLRGIRVVFGTLTPYGGNHYFSKAGEEMRQSVNEWIRNNKVSDGFIDFDLALRDPKDPSHIRHTYDSGDGLHPNDAGYHAMAEIVNVNQILFPSN